MNLPPPSKCFWIALATALVMAMPGTGAAAPQRIVKGKSPVEEPPVASLSWNDIGSGTGPAVVTASPLGAANEHTPPCGVSQAPGSDLTYRWTAPATGGYAFAAPASDFDTILYVYDSNGVALGCTDSEGAPLALSLQGGSVYFIVVDTASSPPSAFSYFTLSIRTQVAAPANVHFLVDNSGSMQELPQVINSRHSEFFAITVNGCQNPRLDAYALSNGWDPNFVYPVPDPGTGLGTDTGFPNLFQDSKYYGYLQWGSSSNPLPQWSGGTKEVACNSQVAGGSAGNPAEYNRCLTCLSTKGYYLVPGTLGRDSAPLQNNNFIFWGRFLNFNPPKYVQIRAAIKQILRDTQNPRVGLSYFATSTPNTVMGQRQNATCDAALASPTSFTSHRASYINTINSLVFNTGTPLARSLLNIGYYFTSDDGVYRDVFGFGSAYNYPPTFKNDALTSQSRSVCWGCQVNAAIIITDGEPTGDAPAATVRTKIRAANGGPVYCPDTAPCGLSSYNGTDKGDLNDPAYDTQPSHPLYRFNDDNNDYYLDDVAKLLYEQDLQRYTPAVIGDFDTSGRQNVSTFTVGFGIQSNLLVNTAAVGGGQYYTADSTASLRQALQSIISTVQTRAALCTAYQ
jgi:type IV pilus assembly protein PilY1